MSTLRPERRQNLLTGEWVLVSPQRLTRPWQGGVEPSEGRRGGAPYDPSCYLCPGNARAEGACNPPYEGVFVFDNDFPALLPQERGERVSSGARAPPSAAPPDPVLKREAEFGVCRVVCYSPDHSLTMADMPEEKILDVVRTWAAETAGLAARGDLAAVTIFENRGAMMGASNPHPHGQIWATSSVPNELARETLRQEAFARDHKERLLGAYLARELAERRRVVLENDAFVAVVPFWAAWPFETLILPRRPLARLDQAGPGVLEGLAQIMKAVTAAYDRVFDAPFPYSMGVHQAPFDAEASAPFTLHVHFYPPLLRSAQVRKFMVGFEMLGSPQRDLTPEAAADRLRAAAGV